MHQQVSLFPSFNLKRPETEDGWISQVRNGSHRITGGGNDFFAGRPGLAIFLLVSSAYHVWAREGFGQTQGEGDRMYLYSLRRSQSLSPTFRNTPSSDLGWASVTHAHEIWVMKVA